MFLYSLLCYRLSPLFILFSAFSTRQVMEGLSKNRLFLVSFNAPTKATVHLLKEMCKMNPFSLLSFSLIHSWVCLCMNDHGAVLTVWVKLSAATQKRLSGTQLDCLLTVSPVFKNSTHTQNYTTLLLYVVVTLNVREGKKIKDKFCFDGFLFT